MSIYDFCKKYNVTPEIARTVKRSRGEVKSRDFDVYDSSQPCEELDAMNQMMAQNSTWVKHYWQQSGPCSNWGYYLARPETDEEYEARIQAEIEMAPVKINDKKMLMQSVKEQWPNFVK